MRKRNFYFRKSKVSSLYTQKYRHTCNKVVSLLRSSRRQFFKNLNPGNKEFWKAVKSVTRNVSEIPILKKGNRMATTPEAKATLLGETFRNNFNSSSPPLSHDDLILMPRSPDTPRIYSDLLCMEPEVFDLLASLDISKATGPDGISAQMLKYTAETITPIITSLFNQLILVGTVPDLWKLSLVVPVHKQGDKNNPGNYRVQFHFYL